MNDLTNQPQPEIQPILECRYNGDVIGCLGYSYNWDKFEGLELADIDDEMDIDLRILLKAA